MGPSHPSLPGDVHTAIAAAFFCPQAKAPDVDYLNGVHSFLSKSPHGRTLLQRIIDLKLDNTWETFAASRSDVAALTQGPQYVDMLHDWAAEGDGASLTTARSGIVALPLLLIVQITQYLRFLDFHSISHRTFLEGVSNGGGLQGYCGGLPAAMAIACAKDEAEVVQHTATAMRIVLGIGAYGEAADDSGGTGSTTLALRLKYEGQGNDLVSRFPGTYISAITDPRSISIVGPSAQLHELFLYAKEQQGIQVQKMEVRGQVHNPENSAIAAQLSRLCATEPTLVLPDASCLQVQVRSNITGQRLEQGPLAEELVTTILASRCEWYNLLSGLAKDMEIAEVKTPAFVYFGLTDCVPLPPFHMVGIRPAKTAAHSLIDIPRNLHKFHDDAIAIVGASCRLPGANNMDELWQMLANGVDRHQQLPTDRFDLPGSFRATQSGNFVKDRTFYGNLIDDVTRFDNGFFGVNAREAANMDPQQRILLELAYEALDDAGYITSHKRERGDNVGCFIGASFVEYLDNTNAHSPTAYTSTGTIRAFLCGRISYYYGWSGPAEVIDTACSSSLVAINRACKAVQNGECDMALTGGINIITGMNNYFDLAKAGFLSPTGQCKPFDVSADGYCRSDGAGLVVLKKLKDAIANGDSILGVIAGTATNQGGLSSSITVPHSVAQQKLYKKVLKQAGIAAEQVTYVETHGTGTQAGDPLEVESIRSVFTRNISREQDTMYIGSIKGNIGHCETAAGIAGLLKVLAMISHRQLPPQANHNLLNPKIPALGPDGLAILRKLRSWDAPLRASLVNSYGAAGSNAALLCCEWQTEQEPTKREPSHAVTIPIALGAATPNALLTNAKFLSSYLRRHATTLDLVSIASTLNYNRASRHKLMANVEATSIEEAASRLDALGQEAIAESIATPSPVVLVFSGQYDNKVGLSRSFYDRLPAFRSHIDACEAEITALGYPSILPTLFDTEPAVDVVLLQCSIFAMQYASAQCWIAGGIKPAAIVGHSLGELTGLAVAGVLSLANAIKLVATRAYFIREQASTYKGSMLALSGCSTQDFETICWLLQQRSNSQAKLEIACYNAPTSLVVAGTSASVDDAEELLRSEPTLAKIRVRRLATTHGFHSSLMDFILPDVDTLTRSLDWNEPRIPLETCTMSQLESFSNYSPSLHVRDSVYFYSAIRRVEERLGSVTWLEAGVDTPVIGMVSKAVAGINNHKFLALKTQGTDIPVDGISAVVTRLWQSGHKASHWSLVPSVNDVPSNKHVWLPPYQFEHTQHWLANVDRVMEMQTEMLKNAAAIRSEDLGRQPVVSTHLVNRRGVDPAALEFVVNTQSHRFRAIVGGHAVRSRPLCPASMYMECVVNALHLCVDGTSTVLNREKSVGFKNFSINAPLGREPDGEVVVQLKRVVEDDIWSFTVRTLSGDGARVKTTSHAAGEVFLAGSPDFGTLQRLASALTGRLENCRDLEKLMAKRAYDLFGRVVNYSDFFKGIASISISEHEAIADVRLPDNQPGRDESPVWSMCDTVSLDVFIQVVGLLMNSDDDVAADEVVVMIGLQSSMVSSDCDMSNPPEYWRVYAKFEIAADGQPLGDVFVSTPEGKLVATMCGCRFMNIPMAKLEKMLDSANRTTVKTIAAASSASSSSASDNSGSETPLTTPSTPDSGEELLSLKALVAEYTGIPVAEIPHDKSLGDLGLDSLASVELVEELQSSYQLDVSSEQLVESTISDLYSLLMHKVTGSARSPTSAPTAVPEIDVAQVLQHLPDGRLDKFNKIVAEVSGAKLSDIKQTETMAELGIDSLSAIDLKQELEDEFAARLPDALVDCTVLELMVALHIAPLSSPPKQQQPSPSSVPGRETTQAKASPPPSEDINQAPTLRSNPFAVLKESDAEFAHSALKNGFSNYWSEAAPLQNRLMIAYIVEAFATLGVDLRTIQLGQRVPQVPFLADKHDKLVPRLWQILYGHDIVSIDQEGTITRGKAVIDGQSGAELQQTFLAQCPRYRDEAALIGLTGPRLADCLVGKADGVQLMFGSAAAMNIMASYYSQSPMISTLTDQLVVFITSLLRTTNGKKPARILEVGAGTGGTTKRLAAALEAAGLPVSYTFTDISPSLVSKAKKTLKQYPWMEYATFDLEKDVPEALRYCFDIVIGTNCVHATSDCTATCARLRQALNPGGIVVLSEVTTIIDWYDISFGLLDGWWLAENRTAYPIRPAETWMTSFAGAGFSSAGFSGSTSRESTSQQLLVACNKHWDVPAPAVSQDSHGSRSQDTVETLVYKEVDGVQVHADVFFPAVGSSTPLPIALMIHGGGHMTLSRRAIRPFQTRHLLDNGFLPVSIDYRLCPEVNLVDGPIADVRDAYKWAKTSLPGLAAKWGVTVDSTKVVAIGWSTGGHLAATLGWTSATYDMPPPAAILSFYAPYDFESGELDAARPGTSMTRTMDLKSIISRLPSKPITNYDNSARGDTSGLGWIRPGDPRSELVLSLFRDGVGLSLLLQGLPRLDASETVEEQLHRQPSLELVASVSPLARLCAGEYSCPTFVIHGTMDEIAPFAGAQRFIQELGARGIPHGSLFLPDVKHIHDVGVEVGTRKWDEQVAPGYRFLFEAVRRLAL